MKSNLTVYRVTLSNTVNIRMACWQSTVVYCYRFIDQYAEYFMGVIADRLHKLYVVFARHGLSASPLFAAI